MDLKDYVVLGLSLLLLVTVSTLQERGMEIRRQLDKLPTPVRWGLLYALLFWVIAFAVTDDPTAGFMYEIF